MQPEVEINKDFQDGGSLLSPNAKECLLSHDKDLLESTSLDSLSPDFLDEATSFAAQELKHALSGSGGNESLAIESMLCKLHDRDSGFTCKIATCAEKP